MPLQPLAVAPSAMMVTPTPLPQAVKIGAIWKRIGAVAIIAMVAVLSRFAVPLVPLWSMLGLWCWRTVSRNTSALDDERNRRVTDHRIAERRWHEVEEKWEVLSGRAAFNQKLGELSAAKHEYERLEVGYRLATQRLEDTVRERQLQKFLSQFHIDDAAIANLGVGRRATLASFGIETAADVERGRILQLRGFGEALTNELLAWRRGLEAQFRFDAARAMDPLDVQALARRFTKRRADLAAVLSAGPQELQRIGVRYEQQRRAFLPSAEEAARALAQANANLLVL